jgi:3-deoxy-D-manno-octulosonic-acid transferase|tara:strand:- start:909 stop:2174 length:1266 start_codon:yes stop_codon:yes gene_type:complete
MFFIYRIIINLILLISPIIIFIRLLKKKENPNRFKEKFCIFTKKRKPGKLIWFHGASVGEVLSIIPLVEKLEKDKDINQILITSNTLSSSKILSNLNLKKVTHQFFPIDTTYHTKKFLDYWNPQLVIFIDSEIWPNMITSIKNRSTPLMLLNARITKKSFKKWKLFNLISKSFFEKFDICLSSSFSSSKYLELLGAKKIKNIGNLKFSQTELNKDLLNFDLKKFFLSKKIWCAASTHATEEKFCGLTHKKLKLKYKNLLTIIIPRHINRSKSIISEMKKLNLKVHTHESINKINDNTDIYLVDSYGKTKSFFKICKVVFLGGSMINHGGQNPLEAARFGCKIIHGENIWNFKEIYKLLDTNNISQKVENLNQMTNKIDKILKNKTNSKNIKSKIKNLGDKILNLTLKEVNFLLSKNETKKT